MRVLVTGGAGYIGSHACKRLLEDGHHTVAVDDLSRGHRAPMDLLAAAHPGAFAFEQCTLGDRLRVKALLDEHNIDTVMHFGALAYVGESVERPLRYYHNNIISAISMLEAIECADHPIERFIFSSSCATYGDPPEDLIPVPETCPQSPTSPYGRTKHQFEQILLDYAHWRRANDRPLALTMLRYFNVAGADTTGVLGEDHDPETHLIPIAIQCALGQRDHMSIFGTDYPTPDGTNIRDYVHVDDLVDAHIRAMERVKPGQSEPYNVGIGKGASVREVIDAVKRVSGSDFEIREAPRRPGDAIALYADPSKIRSELGWSARITDLDEIVRSAYDWMKVHPKGYDDKD
jgi:UDP-glucose 4-epimerase